MSSINITPLTITATPTGGLKFLIIRFSSIGDIVLTTPVLRCLKQQVTGCTIHFVTKSQYAAIVYNNPNVDKVIEFNNSWDEMITALQQENYNYIIDLHHNLRTLRLKKALAAKAFSFNKLNIQKWLLTAAKINTMPNVHIVDRYMATLKKFKVQNDGRGLEYFIPQLDEVRQSDIPSSHLFGYIGLV